MNTNLAETEKKHNDISLRKERGVPMENIMKITGLSNFQASRNSQWPSSDTFKTDLTP